MIDVKPDADGNGTVRGLRIKFKPPMKMAYGDGLVISLSLRLANGKEVLLLDGEMPTVKPVRLLP